MKKVSTKTDTESRYDRELVKISDYVHDYQIKNTEAYEMAMLCLKDALGCAMLALRFPECVKLLGPVIPGSYIPNGARVPGTEYVLDPIQAAFNIGAMIRWVDFNDTWLGREWGHPSDNLGGILAVSDYMSRKSRVLGNKPWVMKDVLTAMIKAYEIQGILSLENSFNKIGLDHVVLVKLASTAVVTYLLGGNRSDTLAALSQVWLDGQSLRTYRHFPNTGPRKSWAAADATSRAVRLAMLTLQGEPGYPSVLSSKIWGFYDAIFRGNELKISRPFDSYVIENILFKASFPAEAHAQTAVEAAFILNKNVKHKIEKIEKIILHTQESAIRIISKTGPLKNFADRDHCIQYMIAVALIYGNLNSEYFGDEFSKDPKIDFLRGKIEVIEDKNYSKDYLDQNKQSVANAIQIFFQDGSHTDTIAIEFPLGHKRRRNESLPALEHKFKNNLATRFPKKRADIILEQFKDQSHFESTPVDIFMEKWII